jgi:fatty-acyl-CoA synthase
VNNVQVIGVSDIKYGQVVMVRIKINGGVEIAGQELIDYCKGTIAHYKSPKYFKFVEGCSKTVTGKVRKVEMRKQSIKRLGLEHLVEN